MNSLTAGRTTWIVTFALAVPPLPSETETVHCTGPSCIGAVHGVCRSAGFESLPAGQLHLYVSASPSGSVASAVSVDVRPTSTVQGSQRATTVGGRLSGFGGAGVGSGGGGGGTYTRTPG